MGRGNASILSLISMDRIQTGFYLKIISELGCQKRILLVSNFILDVSRMKVGTPSRAMELLVSLRHLQAEQIQFTNLFMMVTLYKNLSLGYVMAKMEDG